MFSSFKHFGVNQRLTPEQVMRSRSEKHPADYFRSRCKKLQWRVRKIRFRVRICYPVERCSCAVCKVWLIGLLKVNGAGAPFYTESREAIQIGKLWKRWIPTSAWPYPVNAVRQNQRLTPERVMHRRWNWNWETEIWNWGKRESTNQVNSSVSTRCVRITDFHRVTLPGKFKNDEFQPAHDPTR